MKDSGVEWIREIPDDWIVLKLKYCAFLDSNGVDKKQYDGENLFKSVHYVDVYTHSLHEIKNSNDYLIVSADEKKAESCSLNCGDILMTTSSENPEDIGHSTVVSEDLNNTLFGYHLMRIRPKIAFDLHILKYLFGSWIMRKWFEYRAVGMTRYGLSREDIADARLITPPIKMQHLIGQYLDNKCVAIDSSISQIQSVIEKLKEYRQSIITEAVTKGLHDVPMIDSGVDWIGEIPTNWNVDEISSLSAHLGNGFVGPTRDIFVDNGIRYLQSLHIVDGNIDYDKFHYYVSEKWSNAHKKSILMVDDVLIIQTGDIGKCGYITPEYAGCNCHAMIIVRTIKSKCRGRYLFYYLFSQLGYNLLLREKTGATHPHLNCHKIQHVSVTIPPIDEQEEIVEYLDKKCAAIAKLIADKEQVIDKLEEYKKSLIYECVTGKRECGEVA